MSALILGIVGSPRRLGNCESFIKLITTSMDYEHRLELIRLPKLNIMPCNACYSCIMDKPCPNRDDMERLMECIIKADAVIIASPVYYLGAHSIFKRILDRGFIFYNYLEKTFGKPCILISMYGIKNRVGVSSQTLMTLASFLGLNIKANISIKAALPGEVCFNKKYLEKAKKLASLLFSEKKQKNRYGCPFCGCEIVRLTQNGFICALCHGSFKIDSKGKRIKQKDGGILGPPEYMLKHKEWLKGMKERFLASRKKIIREVIKLDGTGDWIEFD